MKNHNHNSEESLDADIRQVLRRLRTRLHFSPPRELKLKFNPGMRVFNWHGDIRIIELPSAMQGHRE